MIKKTRNTARFFTENPHISWVLLVVHDPVGRVRLPHHAQAQRPGDPGARGGRDARLAGRQRRERRRARHARGRAASWRRTPRSRASNRPRAPASPSSPSCSTRTIKDTAKEFDDIWLKLSSLSSLPEGASMEFMKDFGDTVGADADRGQPARERDRGAAARTRRSKRRSVRLVPKHRSATPRARRWSAASPHSLDDRELSRRRQGAGRLGRIARRPGRAPARAALDFWASTRRPSASDEKILGNARDFIGERLRAGRAASGHLAAGRDPRSGRDRAEARGRRRRKVQLPRSRHVLRHARKGAASFAAGGWRHALRLGRATSSTSTTRKRSWPATASTPARSRTRSRRATSPRAVVKSRCRARAS